MPPDLINVISAYVDTHNTVGGIDFRRNVFIFLSNTGEQEIFDMTLKLTRDNKNRDMFNLIAFQDVVQKSALNTKGKGLYGTKIIKNELIDIYIPFMPLERSHLVDCISTQMNKQGITQTRGSMEKTINDFISAHVIFQPKDFPRFSSSGCRKAVTVMKTMDRKYTQNGKNPEL